MSASIAAPRRVQRVRFEPRRRTLYVARAALLSPGYASVVLSGDELQGFESLSFDDHVKFGVPGADGQWMLRDFTPRAFDAAKRELTIEFALHDQGPASDWARQARAGQPVLVAGPRGSMIVPADYDWHLLAGDASALPAIARRLEELPGAARVLVLADVPAADRRALRTSAQADVRWLDSSAHWLDALRALRLPAGEGFVWCAGEAQTMKQARETLLAQHGHPREALRVAAYWKAGAAAFHENLEA